MAYNLKTENKIILKKGDTLFILINDDANNPVDASNFRFSSSNPFFATVDNNGMITAINSYKLPGSPLGFGKSTGPAVISVNSLSGQLLFMINVIVQMTELLLRVNTQTKSTQNGSDFDIEVKCFVENKAAEAFRIKKAIVDFMNGNKLVYTESDLNTTVYSGASKIQVFTFNTSYFFNEFGNPPEVWEISVFFSGVNSGEMYAAKNERMSDYFLTRQVKNIP